MRHTGHLWFVFLLIFLIFSTPLIAQEPVGAVIAIRGEAAAHDNQGHSRTLSMQSPVYQNDILITGPSGRMQVLFSDNTIVSLGRSSEMEITHYRWNPGAKTGAMKTTVKEGIFRVMGGAITREAPRSFTTETPAATIGIRGSMYAGKVQGEQLMVVFEGGKGIDVINDAGSTAITRPGFGTHVMGADLPPLPPRRFSREELSDLNRELGTGTQTGGEHQEDTPSEDGITDDGSESGTEQGGDESQENEPEGDGEGPTGAETPPAADSSEDLPDSALDSPADSAAQAPPVQEEFTMMEEPLADTLSLEDPAAPALLPVLQEITDTSTTASQDELATAVIDTTETGINLTGMVLAHCTADATTTDFSTWYGSSAAAAINGSTTGSAACQDGDVLNFSFTMTPYNPDAAYITPFDAWGDPMADIQTRYVDLPGIGRTFQTAIFSDNRGEFSVFAIKDGLFTQDSTPYGYQDLGFAGIPSPSTALPVDGISGYFGPALGVDTQPKEGRTMQIETGLSSMMLEVNWLSGKFIGRVDFSSPPPDPAMEPLHKEMTFFFGDIQDNALTNLRLCESGTPEEEVSGRVSWVEGTGEFGRFYGSEYQGIGFTGAGSFYDIASDQSTPIGAGRMIAAGFREIEEDGIDATSPTGIASFQGFVTGLSEDMNNISTNRRLFMNTDSSEFSLTVNRDAGTLSGSLSAVDQVSSNSWISNLEIGGTHGSAYVLDDNMVAILGDAGSNAIQSSTFTGGLKPYGNYLITEEPDLQFSEFASWGYWEISYVDPLSGAQYHLHEPGSYWIAGELTPGSAILDLAANNLQGHYSGGARGIAVNELNEVFSLTNGQSQIAVNFGTYQVSGTITFDEINLALTSTTLSPTTSSFSTQVSGATQSSVHGAFFGPAAQALGGNFDAQMSTTRYMGIFGGERPTTP